MIRYQKTAFKVKAYLESQYWVSPTDSQMVPTDHILQQREAEAWCSLKHKEISGKSVFCLTFVLPGLNRARIVDTVFLQNKVGKSENTFLNKEGIFSVLWQ